MQDKNLQLTCYYQKDYRPRPVLPRHLDFGSIYVPEGQSDVGGRLWQDGEALVGSVGSLGQAQHRHSGQFVDGIQRCLSIKQYLQGTNTVRAASFCTDAKTSESSR